MRRGFALTEQLVAAGGRAGPDHHERYLLFQTLVAVWPITPERLNGYIEKALREAKRNTNWVDQNHSWEARVKRFAVALLTFEPFLSEFEPFVEEVAVAGERSALGQLLLKLTVPGIPDIYNGDELIDLSLVDPDNRRPVDWDARRAALASLRAGEPPSRATMKLHVIASAGAARPPARGVRRGRLRAAGRGTGRGRVHARRRRRRARGGRRAPRGSFGDGGGPGGELARRPR